MKKTENNSRKQWRFFRSQLETIVWDPVGDCVLADFSQGHFTTDDQRKAKYLREKGYPEIPLDATEPPPNVLVTKPTHAIDGDVPVVSANITDAGIIETRMKAKERVVEGERIIPNPPVPRLRRRKKKKK